MTKKALRFNDKEEEEGFFGTRIRYVILESLANEREEYSQTDKSWIMWAMAAGNLCAAFPFQWLILQYGARIVYFGAGMISTLATFLMPLAAKANLNCLLIARFFQGAAFGADFTTIGLITVNWASLKQHGLFIALLSSFSQISVMFTMPVAGNLCESAFGWESIFYVHGSLSLLLFIFWFYHYRDEPTEHPRMTSIELEKIHRGKMISEVDEVVPVKMILSNKVMWAVWLSALGEQLTSQFIVIYACSYLNQVLGFGIAKTGYIVAIPRAVHLCVKIGTGLGSDTTKCIPERLKMIICNSIALMFSGVGFCVLGFITPNNSLFAFFLLLLIECAMGFICGGHYKCATLVARQHAHFVVSAIQVVKCLALFLEPLLVYLICLENTIEEWRIVFLAHAVLLFMSNLFFCSVATDKPAPFTQPQLRKGETRRLTYNPQRRRSSAVSDLAITY